jgi:polar amino acid transport system substrate-binding protein
MKKSIALASLGAAVLMSVAACGGGSAASGPPENCTPAYSVPTTIQAGVLTVTGPDYPPLFTYDGSALGGVDGAFLSYFAQKACLGLDVQVLPASGVIESVRGGRADVAGGGWYITEERAQVVGQTDPVYSDPLVFVAKAPSADIQDYKTATIGTTQGYTFVPDLQRFAGDNVKLYQSPDAVFSDVSNGRIQVGLMAVAEASFRINANPGSGLSYQIMTPDPAIDASVHPPVTDFPFAKDNPELGRALNAAIADFRNEGKLAEALQAAGIDPSAANPAASG